MGNFTELLAGGQGELVPHRLAITVPKQVEGEPVIMGLTRRLVATVVVAVGYIKMAAGTFWYLHMKW
jgi:hypothetical protein